MDNYSREQKIKEGFIGQRMITITPNVIAEIETNELTKDFYTTAIGYYPQAIYHDRRRKSGSKEYILLYCTEGTGFIELEEERFYLKPNSFFIIPPHVAHHYKSATDNPWTIYWAHFKGKSAHVIYKRYFGDPENAVKTIARSERRQKDFVKILMLLQRQHLTNNFHQNRSQFH